MKHSPFIVAGALAVASLTMSASSLAKGPTMVDVARKLYVQATPDAFDRKCVGRSAKLEVTGDRHSCTEAEGATVVRFTGENATAVTVFKNGIRKEVLGQVQRKLGAADSVTTQGAMKMHFWFTKEASVTVGFQSSAKSRSTMVSFRSP